MTIGRLVAAGIFLCCMLSLTGCVLDDITVDDDTYSATTEEIEVAEVDILEAAAHEAITEDITADIITTYSGCPYSSVQIRVQRDTSVPWSPYTSNPVGTSIHIGAFKNGWGVPVDPGTVSVYEVQGSYWQPISLSGWETWRTKYSPGTWYYFVYCGTLSDNARANWY